jgi:hypothetical protein
MDKSPTTEELKPGCAQPKGECGKDLGKVSLLRRELSDKAKQGRLRWSKRSLRESRMREIFMSGSTRGE